MDNIYEFIKIKCNEYNKNPLLVDENGEIISYADFLNQCDLAYSYLNDFIKHSSLNFSIIAPNCPNYLYVLITLLRQNNTAVNLNPNLSSIELIERLNNADVSVLVTTNDIYNKIESLLLQTKICDVYIIDEQSMDFKINLSIKIQDIEDANKTRNNFAFLQFTGGTTGTIKAATISHNNVLANIEQLKMHFENYNKFKSYNLLISFPFYHIFSVVFNFLFFLSSGSKLVIYKNLRDFSFIIEALNKYEISFIVGVNTWYNKLMQHENFNLLKKDKLELCFAGGEYVPISTKEKWYKSMNIILKSAYGLTETSSLCIVSPLSENYISDTIGIAIPETKAILLDDNNNEISDLNISGELALQGNNITQSYYNNDFETAQAFVNGWFKTGDIAIKTNSDTFKIVDRKKDMISVSGNKVYPNEIEEILFKQNGVLDVAVVGRKSIITGEEVALCIVLDNNVTDIETIKLFCEENFTRFKKPTVYFLMNELPKTPIGKTSRRDLRIYVNKNI